MYELWNLLSETGLSDEAKRCICRGMLKGMQRRALIHDGIEAVDRVIVEDFCAIPAKEPEKPTVYVWTIYNCRKCGRRIPANDDAKVRADGLQCYPVCPPKPDGGNPVCSGCGCRNYHWTARFQQWFCDHCGRLKPDEPKQEKVEGLDGILNEIQTDECNQYMHNDAKRRIVETIKMLWQESCLRTPTFFERLDIWGGIAK